MSQIQFHHKGTKDTKKKHISHTILGALSFLGVLGGKVFAVSIEMDTLPLLATLDSRRARRQHTFKHIELKGQLR